MGLFFSHSKISPFVISHIDIDFQNPSLPWIKSRLPLPASFKPLLIFIQFIFSLKNFYDKYFGTLLNLDFWPWELFIFILPLLKFIFEIPSIKKKP